MPHSSKQKQTRKASFRAPPRGRAPKSKPSTKKIRLRRPPVSVKRLPLSNKRMGKKGPSGNSGRRRPKFGERIGSFLGGVAQHTLGTIFGRGEYMETLGNELGNPEGGIKTSEEMPEVNTLVQPVNTDSVFSMHNHSEGCIRVTRREFVSFLNISTNAYAYDFRVDPSRQTSFPWLALMCQNYQQYEFLGLSHEYVPTSGWAVSSESGALGQVVMAYKYDTSASDAGWPGGNPTALMNQSGAVAMSPAAPGACFMECDPKAVNQSVKFVHSPQSQQVDFSTQNFESAILSVTTNGAQNAVGAQCGQLWVTYDILLFHPTVYFNGGPFSKQIATDPVYLKYASIWERLIQLDGHTGPYTTDEYIAREAIVKILMSKCSTTELQERRAVWRAMNEARATVNQSNSTDQPLLDYIHASDVYQVVDKINPAAPARAPSDPELPRTAMSEDWELSSVRSHR